MDLTGRLPPELLMLLTGERPVVRLRVEKPPNIPAPAATTSTWDRENKRWTIWLHPKLVNEYPDRVIEAAIYHELAHIFLGHFRPREHEGQECLLIAADVHVNAMLRNEHLKALLEITTIDPVEWLEKLGLSTPEIDPVHEAIDKLMPEPQEGWFCGGIEITDDPTAMVEAVSAAVQAGKVLNRALGKLAGTDAGMDSLEVSRRPVPKWAERLKEFVDRMVRLELREEPKIRRPLRIPRKHGVIMPSIRGTISEKRASLTVLIDTSGSMIRPGVMGYVKAAVLRAVQNGLRVRLIAGDVAVTVDEEIKGTFPTLIGGGGTDIRPLFERARKYRPSSVVILTDGYVLEWPEDMGIPLLWLRPAKDSDRQKPDWKRVEIIEVED